MGGVHRRYKVEPSYIAGLMDMFGTFDTNSDGAIGYSEFGMLWEFFGGTPEMAKDVLSDQGYDGEGETAAESKLATSDHPLKASFVKYGLTSVEHALVILGHSLRSRKTRVLQHPVSVGNDRLPYRNFSSNITPLLPNTCNWVLC